ncbi:hypothetical protein LV779_12570 [Streptomyces thinghirensis]|nr:hypothetical protein [Streptomyces thinghirensis]
MLEGAELAESIATGPGESTRPSAPSKNGCGRGPARGRRSRRPVWNAS